MYKHESNSSEELEKLKEEVNELEKSNNEKINILVKVHFNELKEL